MPELPEVETVCRGLAKVLLGERIEEVKQHRPDLRAPLPRNLPSRLKGKQVVSIHRRAKYILIELDNGEVLLVHLGMSGRFVISHHDRKPAEKHDHLVFYFTHDIVVRFNDPRRFGLCDLIAKKDLEKHKLMRHLGIEPLGKKLTRAFLQEKLKGKKSSLKAALMDQRLIAGLGNIYVCEALFYAGISPRRRAGNCKAAELAKLVLAIRKVLSAAIKAGGSSLRDYVQANGELGYFQNHFAVYGREGKFCPACICKANGSKGLRRIIQQGRSSFYCPTKQV